MTQHLINKLNTGKFALNWVNVPNSELILNFNPLISTYKLTGTYCLLHWQAKPKFYRRWGIYYSATDYYYSFEWNRLIINERLPVKALQISESKYRTVPTAVIYLQAKLTKVDKGIILNAV